MITAKLFDGQPDRNGNIINMERVEVPIQVLAARGTFLLKGLAEEFAKYELGLLVRRGWILGEPLIEFRDTGYGWQVDIRVKGISQVMLMDAGGRWQFCSGDD